MGKLYLEYWDGDNLYVCVSCKAHLSTYNQIISKAFRGRGGKAFLFNSVINTESGPLEERVLLSGLHLVADLYCKGCKTYVGWKYEKAYEPSQKYKEGKYILEREQISKLYWTM